MRGTKYWAAPHLSGSVLEHLLARPHPALTGGLPPPGPPQKAPPARGGGAFSGGPGERSPP
eukprot:7944969-Alexandrium_andersonii.AAC.1